MSETNEALPPLEAFTTAYRQATGLLLNDYFHGLAPIYRRDIVAWSRTSETLDKLKLMDIPFADNMFLEYEDLIRSYESFQRSDTQENADAIERARKLAATAGLAALSASGILAIPSSDEPFDAITDYLGSHATMRVILGTMLNHRQLAQMVFMTRLPTEAELHQVKINMRLSIITLGGFAPWQYLHIIRHRRALELLGEA